MSCACLGRRYCYGVRYPGGLPVPFIVDEKERVIFPEWTADRAAELIALEGRNARSVEVVPSIKRAVSEELICGSMEAIRARASDGADHAGRGPSVFCWRVRSQHREL